jgi:hypothetical protein
MLRTYRLQNAMYIPLSLLYLLCSCGSSSVPDESSSTQDKKEEKAVNSSGEQATSKASDNGSVISKSTPEQKNISSVVTQRAEGQHSVLTHTATTPMERRPSLDVPQASLDVPQASLDVPQASLDVPQASLNVPQASLDVPQASLDVPQASLDVPQASLDVPQASLDVPQASLDVPQGISLVSFREGCAGPTHPMSSAAKEGCSSSTYPVVAPNNAARVSAEPPNEVLTPQELLQAKLDNPDLDLNTTQSISLIEHCAQLGEQSAVSATEKDAIAILGETGTGKSTAINSWTGCQMVLRTPEELEIQGGSDGVIVVSPDSALPEATSIGHGAVSHTFMPQVIQDPNRDTRVYLDCPGFSDNRGSEINIANAINTRRVLQQALGVKAVFLADYSNFIGRRGVGIQFLENVCGQLFGGINNLRNHQDSVLLGINRAPRDTRLQSVRTRCANMRSPIMQILANRTFLYDPLDQGGEDFWARGQFLAAIERMPCIPQEVASDMFQTALDNGDRVALQRIVEHQVGELERTLEEDDYPAASRCWNLLKQLRVIGHGETAESMERQVIPHMRAYATERTATFNDCAAQHNFTEAERLLASLRVLNEHFPEETLLNLDNLNATLNTAQAQHTAQLEAEEEARRAGEEARRAEEEARRAEEEARRAEEEVRRAEEETRRAEEETRKAEEEARRAGEETRRAEEEARKNREAFEREQQLAAQARRRQAALEAELEAARRRRNNIPPIRVEIAIPIPCTIM